MAIRYLQILPVSANAHSNPVSGLEDEEESVDGENKEATALDSNDKDFAKEESEKSSGIKDNLENNNRGSNSKKSQDCKRTQIFPLSMYNIWAF